MREAVAFDQGRSGKSMAGRLTEEMEFWKERALAAEALLKVDQWDTPIPSFTLPQTRCLRLLAANERVSYERFYVALYDDLDRRYSEASQKAVQDQLYLIRQTLPEEIEIRTIHKFGYRCQHRSKLRALLSGENLIVETWRQKCSMM